MMCHTSSQLHHDSLCHTMSYHTITHLIIPYHGHAMHTMPWHNIRHHRTSPPCSDALYCTAMEFKILSQTRSYRTTLYHVTPCIMSYHVSYSEYNEMWQVVSLSRNIATRSSNCTELAGPSRVYSFLKRIKILWYYMQIIWRIYGGVGGHKYEM